MGFDVGEVDGRFGDRTEAALSEFAERAGVEAEGAPAMQAILGFSVAANAAASGWYWPLPGAPGAIITSQFCWRDGRHHNGIDPIDRRVAVPKNLSVAAGHTDALYDVLFTVRTRKENDTHFGRHRDSAIATS